MRTGCVLERGYERPKIRHISLVDLSLRELVALCVRIGRLETACVPLCAVRIDVTNVSKPAACQRGSGWVSTR